MYHDEMGFWQRRRYNWKVSFTRETAEVIVNPDVERAHKIGEALSVNKGRRDLHMARRTTFTALVTTGWPVLLWWVFVGSHVSSVWSRVCATAISSLYALYRLALFQEGQANRTRIRRHRSDIVVVEDDLDPAAQRAWAHVRSARHTVDQSTARREGHLDVDLSATAWQIARRLADLSKQRWRRRHPRTAPDTSECVDASASPAAVEARAPADVGRQIHALREFARLVEEADAALAVQAATDRLAALDRRRHSLIAVDGGFRDATPFDTLDQQVSMAAAQVAEALRRADEAGDRLLGLFPA